MAAAQLSDERKTEVRTCSYQATWCGEYERHAMRGVTEMRTLAAAQHSEGKYEGSTLDEMRARLSCS